MIKCCGTILAATIAVQTAKAVCVVGDANAETTISPSNTIIKMTKNGTLTVTEPGEIEILLVGGGGGGGENWINGGKTYYGGGGGAGGVIHKMAFQVSAGEWEVIIGAGGAVGVNGGKTMAFGMTAWGGGRGAKGAGIYEALSGASGGGGARYYYNDQADGRNGYKGAPAKSEYINDYFNLGNAGSNAANEERLSGHGGGAGGAAKWDAPGSAYHCSITGADVAYAGGGGGYAWNVITGVGGGKNSYGGGGNMNDIGGGGVVIVRFTRDVSKETVFEDATGGMVTTCRVGDERYRVHTFSQSGQFTIPCHGHVEVLVVGGGGGSGGGAWPYLGGGGGAGGVVHKSELFITNGVYDIVIGTGGAVGTSGGATTAFGITAYGGGHGATRDGANAASGASGGGGACCQWWNDGLSNSRGAEANIAYTNAPYCNLGHAGSAAPYKGENSSGAGGGAGGPAGAGTPDKNNGSHLAHPGIAYICSITGTDVAYAGGGGGCAYGVLKTTPGGGMNSYGGGGNSIGSSGKPGEPGGSGVVIIRYQMPKHGMAVVVR